MIYAQFNINQQHFSSIMLIASVSVAIRPRSVVLSPVFNRDECVRVGRFDYCLLSLDYFLTAIVFLQFNRFPGCLHLSIPAKAEKVVVINKVMDFTGNSPFRERET
jgi:hypothetical protein